MVTDFGSYSDFLPEIESCEVLRQDGKQWDVAFTVKIVKRFRYTLRLSQTNENQIRWHMTDGAFKSNDGGWDIEPLDGGSRTRATYFIDLQVGMFVPSSLMRNAVNRSLPDTVMRFKAEVERRFPTT